MPSEQEDKAIRLTLSTTSPAYKVGDNVTAVLHAISAEDVWTDLQELEVVFCGVERVDTAWVSRSYRQNVAAINTDKRRVQRVVVRSRLQAATQGNFSDADFRRFIIGFTLPKWLPPSFKGTAVRYSYYLEAIMRYRKDGIDLPVPPDYPGGGGTQQQQEQDPSFSGGSNPDTAVTDTTQLATTTVRLPILVWPDKDYHAPPGDGDPFMAGSETVPVKCWEIGPGTAVDDAITHIAGLATQLAGTTMPQTPSFTHREDSRTNVSDTASEISHDNPANIRQPQQQPHRRTTSTALSESDINYLQASLQSENGPYRSYMLRMGSTQVARVSLQPPLEGRLRPGTTLGGTVEYPTHMSSTSTESTGSTRQQQPRCVQLSLSLESEEAVDATWRPPGKSAMVPLRRMHDELLEVTTDLASTSFLFTLPLDATPSFHTPLLGLRWQLRFQFTVVTASGKNEILSWTLPIGVESPA